MTRSSKGSPELAEQGQELDREQQAKLLVAKDPVYAHLATLSTSAAMLSIEWDITEKKGIRSLAAIRHQQGKKDKPATDFAWNWVGGSVDTEAGVRVSARTEFEAEWDARKRVFPQTIDKSLQASNRSHTRLLSTEVVIIRDSEVYGVPALKVGLLAVHASRGEPTLSIVNESVRRHEFNELLSLLDEIAEPSGEGTGVPSGSVHVETRPRTTGKISTLPGAHFAFHEALGVPEDVLTMARQNYGTLVEHMGLPYEMPAQQ